MNEAAKRGSRLLACLAAVCIAVCMALAALPTTAHADDDAIRKDRSGVMKFVWTMDNETWGTGSCFLINDDTVITAYHCTMFSTGMLNNLGLSGLDVAALRDHAGYAVVLDSGVKVGAKIQNYSETQDFAILKLDQSLNGHEALAIGDSRKVDANDAIHSLGFPADADQAKVLNTYSAEDVTVRQGTVVKPEDHYQFDAVDYHWDGYYLQTSCPINSGDSGGPMVDSNGAVVGISVAGGDGYYYASASDRLTSVLDQLGIEYTKAEDSSDDGSKSTTNKPVTENTLDFSALDSAISRAKDIQRESGKYTDEYIAELNEMLAKANEAKNIELSDSKDNNEYTEKQGEIKDAAAELNKLVNAPVEKPETPIGLIIGIAVAAIAIIAIIIILVMRSRKNKGDAGSASTSAKSADSAAQSASAPQSQSSKASGWSKPGAAKAETADATVVSSSDAAETVVGAGDSAQTVVSYQKVEGGTLTRMSTNEKIEITNAKFTIGRERGKVDYQLEGNDISRTHARIEVRNGRAFIIDNNSSNGTYVNRVKLRAGVEQQLKDGDIIEISDEKFKYTR